MKTYLVTIAILISSFSLFSQKNNFSIGCFVEPHVGWAIPPADGSIKYESFARTGFSFGLAVNYRYSDLLNFRTGALVDASRYSIRTSNYIYFDPVPPVKDNIGDVIVAIPLEVVIFPSENWFLKPGLTLSVLNRLDRYRTFEGVNSEPVLQHIARSIDPIFLHINTAFGRRFDFSKMFLETTVFARYSPDVIKVFPMGESRHQLNCGVGFAFFFKA